MFANFEVCKAGLVTAALQRRHLRATTGCSQCRKRKKKCDERRPICSLCAKHGTLCVSTAKSRKGPHPPSSPDTALLLAQTPDTLEDSLNSQHDIGIPGLSTMACVQSPVLSAFNLPKEQRSLQFLLDKFAELTCPSYVDPKFSILHHALPIAVKSTPTKYALMACGFALLAMVSPEIDDIVQAKSYQCKALSSLARNLLEAHGEDTLPSILLLHIFEKISCDSLPSKRLHLLGANTIIASTMANSPSESTRTMPHKYLIEAYAYHVALSSTFSSVVLSPFPDDYVSKLLALLREPRRELGYSNLWMESCLMGVSHGIFDVIFRSSLLRRQLPLTSLGRHYGQTLKITLVEWEWPSSVGGNAEISGQFIPSPPERMLRTGRLYRLACLLLLEKVLNTSLKSSDDISRCLIREFCQILLETPSEDTRQAVHLWPLLVMGSAANSPTEHAIFSAPFEYNKITASFGNWDQGYSFLLRSWAEDGGLNGPLGLDILLRDDILCEMFI